MWNGRKYLQIMYQIEANIQNIWILLQLNKNNDNNNLILKISRQFYIKFFKEDIRWPTGT